jgi:hypothetical protein
MILGRTVLQCCVMAAFVLLASRPCFGSGATEQPLKTYAAACERVFDIGERDLLSPEERWPTSTEVTNDSARMELGRLFGLLDSADRLSSDIVIRALTTCRPKGLPMVELYHVTTPLADKDVSVYMLTRLNGAVAGQSIVATLHATCKQTFLRVSYMDESHALRVATITHYFDCDEDAFLRTERGVVDELEIGADGSIQFKGVPEEQNREEGM